MASKSSSPASAFTKVLRSFETGGFTSRDVVSELKRLLKAGASPNELSEILRRREFVEPLPVDAHKEVLGLLDAAKERAAAAAGEQQAESAAAGASPPTIAPTAARTEGARKTVIQLAPPPRIPDPAPTPESEPSEPKLITVPVQMPAARTTHAPAPAPGPPSAFALRRSPPADGFSNVVARAITLARTSASPARASALPDSMRRRTGRIAPAAKSTSPQRTAPLSTPIPPAEKRVTDGKTARAELPAQAELPALDDWSDLAVLRQDPAPASVEEGSALKARGVSPRGSIARVIGWSAVALATAAAAWFVAHRASLPTNPAVAAAAPIPGTLIRDCPTCAAMIVLPAARFKQGYSDTDRGAVSYEKPEHWVNISRSFAMSADLVTVEDYRRFADATGRALH